MLPNQLLKLTLGGTLLILPFTASADTLSPSGYAFGLNQVCQLQDDGQVNCSVRGDVTRLLPPNDLPPLTTLTLGEFHACGLTFDAQAVCWGANDFGQLNVPLIDVDLVQIDAGQHHTCALDASGEAFCWGLNNNRQLEPPAGERYSRLELGNDASCGIRDTGELSCWTTAQASVTRNFTDPFAGPFTDIDIFDRTLCSINDAGSVICNISSFEFTDGPYTDIAVTSGVQCALDQESTLQCLTVVGTRPDRSFPVGEQFLSIHGVEANRFTSAMCGERLDGVLQCWGTIAAAVPLPNIPSSISTTSAGISDTLDLDARIYGRNALEIFWQPIIGIVTTGFPRRDVEVFRNGEFLERTGSQYSFFDGNALVENNYQLRLVDDLGNTGPLSAVLSVNTELGTVLFDGEPPVTDGSLPAPVSSDLITNTNLQPISGGYIASWTIDQEQASASDLAGFEIFVGGESAGFTRSRLFVETEDALAGRCVEIVAINSSGSVLDSVDAEGFEVGTTGCR